MKDTFEVPKFVIEQTANALRLAANIMGSRERETAADRQIEYAERLMKWVLNGSIGDIPRYIPILILCLSLLSCTPHSAPVKGTHRLNTLKKI